MKRISQRNGPLSLLPFAFFWRNHYFYFVDSCSGNTISVPLFLLPLRIFQGSFQLSPFLQAWPFPPKMLLPKLILTSSMLLHKCLTHASFPMVLSVLDQKTEIARTQVPSSSWSWHWLPFRIWPLRLCSWVLKSKRAPPWNHSPCKFVSSMKINMLDSRWDKHMLEARSLCWLHQHHLQTWGNKGKQWN